MAIKKAGIKTRLITGAYVLPSVRARIVNGPFTILGSC